MISAVRCQTPGVAKYIQQLARHFGHKIDVSLDERSANFALQAGTVRLDAKDGALVARIEAEDAKSLINARHALGRNLAGFASREGLAGLNWQVAGSG